jgi:hypothetical protein
VTEVIIDHTSSYEVFSFLDGQDTTKSRWMQKIKSIQLFAHRDILLQGDAFRAGSKWRCYRAMTKIFDDHLIHQIVECYVDDLVVKATSKEEHLEFLRIVFMRLRK